MSYLNNGTIFGCLIVSYIRIEYMLVLILKEFNFFSLKKIRTIIHSVM